MDIGAQAGLIANEVARLKEVAEASGWSMLAFLLNEAEMEARAIAAKRPIPPTPEPPGKGRVPRPLEDR